MVPVLGVSLILAVFLVNLLGNRMIQGVASFIGILKIGGILTFGLVGVWIADSLSIDFSIPGEAGTLGNFFGATALGILAFKGFTTITNSGSEVKDPHRNVGRARHPCQHLCSLADAGHADRDETGSAQSLWHAGQHPEAHAGLHCSWGDRRIRKKSYAKVC